MVHPESGEREAAGATRVMPDCRHEHVRRRMLVRAKSPEADLATDLSVV